MKIRTVFFIILGIAVLVGFILFANHFGILDFGSPLSVISEKVASGSSSSGGIVA